MHEVICFRDFPKKMHEVCGGNTGAGRNPAPPGMYKPCK